MGVRTVWRLSIEYELDIKGIILKSVFWKVDELKQFIESRKTIVGNKRKAEDL